MVWASTVESKFDPVILLCFSLWDELSEESSSVTLPFFLDFLFFFLAPSDEINNDMSKTKRIRWHMQVKRIVATVLLTSFLPPLVVYSRGWTQRIDSLVAHVQTEIVHRAADVLFQRTAVLRKHKCVGPMLGWGVWFIYGILLGTFLTPAGHGIHTPKKPI